MHEHQVEEWSVRQYIEYERWDRSVDFSFETPRHRALRHCWNWCETACLNLTALYWATQCKCHQLAFRRYDRSELDGNPEQKLLCAKCGHWVPAQSLHLHLPLAELQQLRAHPEAWNIQDQTPTCKEANQQEHSPEEDSHYRSFFLEKPDWPVVCPICNVLIMQTYFAVHSSSISFCKQARLATYLSGGTLTTTRFSWYPGHPKFHLFYIDRWPCLALLALHHKNLVLEFDALHKGLLLREFQMAAQIPDLLLTRVAQFLFFYRRDSHVLQLALDGQIRPAIWVMRKLIQKRPQVLAHDVLSLSIGDQTLDRWE